jgi:glutathione S-transferase
VPEGRERMMGYGRLADTMNALEGAVSQGAYIAGDNFTAADVYVGSQIGFGLQFGTIEKRPAFERYWERLRQRPAAVRAKEIDDAMMPPQA